MSIEFTNVYGKVKIKLSDGISRGYSIYTNSEEEAVNSLKHYYLIYLMKHNKRKCAICKTEE